MGDENLFSRQLQTKPLAERLRPENLEQVVGQDHLLKSDGPIGRMVARGKVTSCLLWGPPGCGKTSLARLLARHSGLEFEPLSAVFSGVSDLRKVFERAKERQFSGIGTLLFVDEIHRFNRAQQDSFLPYVEDGTVVLIGATTENPSFELNAALISRARVLVLHRLDDKPLEQLLKRAEDEEGVGLPLDAEARTAVRGMADGDGRYLINLVEQIYSAELGHKLTVHELLKVVQKRMPIYDKGQDSHFNLISALHKSMRGSDCDAALYWLARMLAGGEDPRYIARRITRFAFEDIGMADPNALPQAIAAWEAFERIGSPEGELALAQAVIYLSTAPKSNAQYVAFKAANQAAKKTGSLSPPKHILNAPTSLMKDLGYGSGYNYDHDAEDGFSGQDYFPDDMMRESYYNPKEMGFERDVKKRLDYWANLRRSKNS
ncbi:replication-associated recombination protein A [Alphaproteobacteria bacterium]|nr:replication-associated recombination protein A [Alphaproteobacteria bacterium]